MTTTALLIVLIVLIVILILLIWFGRGSSGLNSKLDDQSKSISRFEVSLDKTEKTLNDGFQRNRTESNEVSKINREELNTRLNEFGEKFTSGVKDINEGLRQKFDDLILRQAEINKENKESIKDVREAVSKQLIEIRSDNTKQLEEMRKTVDEKLEKTLNTRLSQSFETVGKQLQAVQEGLGEMKNLANDVGGLKKVLSNVKMRGSFGEIQLSMLLEQILAPDQYESNVQTKKGSSDVVEFALKLPGRNDDDSSVWLPIDAKFPKDVYETLQEAYEVGDVTQIAVAQKQLDVTIKKMAKDISEKYIDPPNTTDFGIMFLPFEGIYAEVVRKAALLEDLQRNYKVIVTGPTTLAAILNSLQMGFKTLAIQKRSGEVWQVLGAVKKEFENFGGLMEKAQKNIRTGLGQLDDVIGKRTRAIQRKLKGVEALSQGTIPKVIPDLTDLDDGLNSQSEDEVDLFSEAPENDEDEVNT